MASKKSREERKAAIEKLRDRWRKADGTAKKANMEAGAVKKDEQDKVVAAALKLGIPKNVFKDTMTLLDHVEAAHGHREKIVEHDDADRLTHYDRLVMLTEDALPLFSHEEVDEIDKSAGRITEDEKEGEPEEPAEDGKVVSMKDRKADKEPAAAASG